VPIGRLKPKDASTTAKSLDLPHAKFRRPVGVIRVVHSRASEVTNRSNSDTGINRWRSARFGLISPRPIRRRRVMGEIPPRYAQASFNLRAAGDIWRGSAGLG